MAVKVNWLDAKTYAAKFDRRLLEHLFPSEGILATAQFATPLKVQEQATPAMFVDVLGGDCVINGDNSTDYGHALFFSDGTATLAIAASDPTNPRIDIVIARFYDDSTEPGSYGELAVVTGTPAASPVAPTTPSNAYKLANVAVAAAVITITNASITNFRVSIASPDRLAKAEVYLAADQLNLANNTWVKVLLDTTVYNHGITFSSNRLTIVSAGDYDISAGLAWVGASVIADKRYALSIYKSGVIFASMHQVPAAVAFVSNTITRLSVPLGVGDYIELFACQVSGVDTPDISGGLQYTYLTIRQSQR